MRQLLQVFRRWQDVTPERSGFVVTIGNFDGVHLGHAKLLEASVTQARILGSRVLVMTFDPHPSEYFSGKQVPRLSIDSERARLLAEQGADVLLVQKFDEQFAALEPDEFVLKVLKAGFNTRCAVVGQDFRFGRDRRGSVEHISNVGIDTVVVPPLCCEGFGVISSTAIRNRLAAGEVEIAARMLGYPYGLFGEIVKGDQKGRTIGFPTANLRSDVQLIPGLGVYAGTITLEGAPRPLASAINIGFRPTVAGTTLRIEAHAIDLPVELDAWYGKRAAFHFHKFLRGERKFSGLQELSEQITMDVAATREHFS